MTLFAKLLHPTVRPRDVRKRPASQYQAVAELASGLRHSPDISSVRIQREWLAMFLAGVMVLGLVAGLYLNVTARAAIAGREIQTLEVEIAANKRVNADLQTQIAVLLSQNVLSQRAKAMGFELVSRDNLEYILVPGYYPPQGVSFVQPAPETDLLADSPEYTESLFEWLGHQIEAASKPLK